MDTTPSLKLVHRFCERLLAQTEIDADLSAFMFSFADEGDKIRRKQMVAEYWGLQELNSSSGEEGLGSEEGDSSLPPGEYDAKSLLVDQIEAAVSFAVDKLFLHYEIYQFISFFNNTLELVGERLQDSWALPTCAQALKHFETSLVPNYSTRITEHNFLEAVGYIKETIFHHFHLYQFLLTREQPIDLTTLYYPIEVLPAEPLPLVQGIEEEEWNRREKIEQLDVERALKERELIEHQRKSEVELKEKLKSAYQIELAKIDEAEGKLMTLEGVAKVTESLLTAHIDLMTSTVTHAMQAQALALNTRLKRVEMLSNKPSVQLSSPGPKKGAVSPAGKKSRNSSRLSNK